MGQERPGRGSTNGPANLAANNGGNIKIGASLALARRMGITILRSGRPFSGAPKIYPIRMRGANAATRGRTEEAGSGSARDIGQRTFRLEDISPVTCSPETPPVLS